MAFDQRADPTAGDNTVCQRWRRAGAIVAAMKVSIDPSHPAYHDWAFKVCAFYLDGAQRNNVLTADEEGRRAITRRLDEKGEPLHDRSGRMLTDEFRGSVRIECPDWLRHEVENAARAAVTRDDVLAD